MQITESTDFENGITCPCCGAKMPVQIQKSMYIGKFCLDLKPEYEHNLFEMFECEYCHFCGTDIEENARVEVQAIVGSKQYQDIFYQDMDSIKKKYIAASKLAETPDKAAMIMMNYCWYLEFKGEYETARNIREEVVDIQKLIIDKEPVIDVMFQLLDSLRQLGRIEEAMDMIKRIKPMVNPVDDTELVKLLVFEKNLIVVGDTYSHFQDEIAI